jgi:hypothetical protein
MRAENRILDLAGETPAARVEAAKNYYVQAMTALRNSEPIVIRGENDATDQDRTGRTLIEDLMDCELATTSFTRAVGIEVYYARRCGNCWEARCCFGVPKGELVCLGTLTFRTAEETWTACHIWRRCNLRKATHADYFAAIAEVPYYFVQQIRNTKWWGDQKSFLTDQDFREAEDARVAFACRRKPALAKLCHQLGYHAVLDPKDERLEKAHILDAALNTGTYPKPLPPKYQHLEAKLKNLVRRYKRLQESPARKRQRLVQEDLLLHWISIGYIFSSKQRLASLINLRHHTRYSAARIARECRMLGLKAKRASRPLKQYAGKELDDEVAKAQAPVYEMSTSFFFTSA